MESVLVVQLGCVGLRHRLSLGCRQLALDSSIFSWLVICTPFWQTKQVGDSGERLGVLFHERGDHLTMSWLCDVGRYSLCLAGFV